MKKALVMMSALLIAAVAAAQDAPPPPPDGGPHGGARNGRGFRGDRGPRGGMMFNMKSPRTQAEEELSKKAPEEFAALLKERAAVEEKMQALAKKNGIQLPESEFVRAEKMAAFQKKYEKELKEIDEQAKTDPRGAFQKRMELMKKEGIEFGGPRGSRGDRGNMPPPPDGNRENFRAKIEAQIKEKFPEEYAAYLKTKETDPKAANEQLRNLAKKLRDSEKKAE